MIDRDQFLAAIERLVNGPLREALGFTIESSIPFYRGIAGYLINVPMMWTRRTRFPLLFVTFDPHNSNMLSDIEKQVQASKSTTYFALLVVVPTGATTGNEAEELRRRVNDSVYRNDFVVLDQQHLSSIIVRNSTDRLVEIILQQGIELSTVSPYVVKGPVPPSMFFGRETEIKTISQSIQQTNFALVGGRRIGKSSILQRLNDLFNRDHRYYAVYLNCEDIFKPAEFLSEIAVKLDDGMQDHDLSALSSSLQFRQIVERVGQRQKDRQVVFLLDEVDELLSSDAQHRSGGQLFKTFRALVHERRSSFVFSGSRTLYASLHDASSPFFNFCQDIALKPLAEKSVAEIVSKPMHQLGIRLPDEEKLIDRMISLTSCHPCLVQWLCNELLRTTTTRQITSDQIDELGSGQEFYKYFLETAQGDATPLEKLVSVLPEQEPFTLDDLYAAASRYGLKNKTAIRKALETLELFALIRRQDKRYRFVLTHYPRIVREAEDVAALIEDWLSRVEV